MVLCNDPESRAIHGKEVSYYATFFWLSLGSLVYQRVLFERVPYEVARIGEHDPGKLLRTVLHMTGRIRMLALINVIIGGALLTALHPCAAASRRCRASARCDFYFPMVAVCMGIIYFWRAANLAPALGMQPGVFPSSLPKGTRAEEQTALRTRPDDSSSSSSSSSSTLPIAAGGAFASGSDSDV